MQIILLQRVEKLGALGELVTVKNGYARNYLLPQGKALRATKDNISVFESQKAALQQQNEQRKAEFAKIGEKLNGTKAVIIRQASEAGQLFGSVSARDIAEAVNAQGFKIERNHVRLNQAIKLLGLTDIQIELHPEVVSTVTINVARSEDEAKLQEKRGAEATKEADKNEAKANSEAAAPADDQPDYNTPASENAA